MQAILRCLICCGHSVIQISIFPEKALSNFPKTSGVYALLGSTDVLLDADFKLIVAQYFTEPDS